MTTKGPLNDFPIKWSSGFNFPRLLAFHTAKRPVRDPARVTLSTVNAINQPVGDAKFVPVI
jgi:hypothetical protein